MWSTVPEGVAWFTVRSTVAIQCDVVHSSHPEGRSTVAIQVVWSIAARV
jgi:hypothetical protein